MRIDILTTFPEMFGAASPAALGVSIPGRAMAAGLLELVASDIRAFSQSKHKKTDDRPYGGGPGMVMTCQPVWDAVMAAEEAGAIALQSRGAQALGCGAPGTSVADASTPARTQPTPCPFPLGGGRGENPPPPPSLREGDSDPMRSVGVPKPRRILMSPQGVPLTQALVEQLAREPWLLIIAGHYEGLDERVIERLAPMEVSIGDYVLSGGELAAMVLIDAITRLIPGVLGDEDSNASDSFSPVGPNGERLLDCPHYTKPREWMGMAVPDVLLNGHHAEIAKWRQERMVERTKARRPDLLDRTEPRA